MKLIAVDRPPVCTGVTADGWLTWRAGDVLILAFEDDAGAVVYQTRRVS